jgi:hypothetical protein
MFFHGDILFFGLFGFFLFVEHCLVSFHRDVESFGVVLFLQALQGVLIKFGDVGCCHTARSGYCNHRTSIVLDDWEGAANEIAPVRANVGLLLEKLVRSALQAKIVVVAWKGGRVILFVAEQIGAADAVVVVGGVLGVMTLFLVAPSVLVVVVALLFLVVFLVVVGVVPIALVVVFAIVLAVRIVCRFLVVAAVERSGRDLRLVGSVRRCSGWVDSVSGDANGLLAFVIRKPFAHANYAAGAFGKTNGVKLFVGQFCVACTAQVVS